jgi:UDP-glucose 4-epimerase
VVAIFCGHLVEGNWPTVYGDGPQTREWVDDSDVVPTNLLAAESDVTGPVNIRHGPETSVLELLEALDDVAEQPMLEPVFAPERPGEVRRSCLDVARARVELGWGGQRAAARRTRYDLPKARR